MRASRGDDAPALPGRAVAVDEDKKSIDNDANKRAVKRYRDRQRDAKMKLESENAALRVETTRLATELAHARWVLDAVASRCGMKRRATGRDADAALRRSVARVIHGAGCPLGHQGRDGDGPFRLDATEARRREDEDEDELAAFLKEFLVHEDGKCACPGRARDGGE
jgi:hypothetical protein